MIQERFVSQFRQQVFNDEGSENGNKLRTYRTLKSDFEFEPYLHNHKDINMRKNITKLRISAHDLMIEQGHYHRPKKLEIPQRICTHCSQGAVEDEKHVIMTCPRYTKERERHSLRWYKMKV